MTSIPKYTGPFFCVQARPKFGKPIPEFKTVERYSDQNLANLRMKYWVSEFVFGELFVWRVHEEPKPS